MMGRRRTIRVGVFLLCLVALQARAVTEIKAIEFKNVGVGPLDESFVAAHISTRVDTPLNRLTVARDVKALLAVGRFSDVRVEMEPLGTDGVQIVYLLRNKLRLGEPVVVEGTRRLGVRKLRSLLDLSTGDLVDDRTLGNLCRRVKAEYRKHHCPDAEVSWDIVVTDPGEGLARVVVRVDEGYKVSVRYVQFLGNDQMAERKLRKLLKQPRWWNPLRLFRKRRYDPGELEAIRLGIRDLYLREGFLDVEVDPLRLVTGEKGRQTVVASIREGSVYRFGKVALGSVSLFEKEKLEGLIRAAPGAVASSSALQATEEALADYYGSRGYLDTFVRSSLVPDPDQRVVDVLFEVREGELTRIGNIQIRGNTRTRDKVVRRELLVYPGEVYNQVRVKRSEAIVRNLGFFSDVRSYPEVTSVAGERDLVMELEEKRTGQFMVGAGFSSIDNLMGFLELSQGNFDINGWPYFTGGGQKLKLRGEFGSTRQDYRLSFTEAWFLGRKLSFGVDLYSSDVDYSDYDIARTGMAIKLGKALPGPNRINMTYRIEHVDLSNIADTNEYVYADSPGEVFTFEEEDRIKSTVGLSLLHDTRNNPFFPSRGNSVKLFASVSGGPFGFDTDIYGIGFQSSHYTPLWWGHVLSLRTRFEVVEEYGSTDEMPVSDRLFIGGGRTLRGFDYRDVGPKVVRYYDDGLGGSTEHHRPVGGRSLAMVRVAYTVPVVAKIRVATFYDIGNVWRDAYELDMEVLASSVGVGLRLDVPGFPIRIDRAWVVEKDNELTDSDAWSIWIGYDY